MKAFAIFSVLCAHTHPVLDSASDFLHRVSQILSEIGAVGVGVFFVISGYLFQQGRKHKKSFGIFVEKKFKGLIIPWVTSATIVYLYVAIRKGGSVLEYLLMLVGYESYCWYMTVLFVIYIIFYVFTNAFEGKYENIAIVGMILMSVVSICLRGCGIIRSDAIGIYLNIFNWGIFFAVGMVFAKAKVKFVNSIFNCLYICIVAILCMYVGAYIFNQTFSYYSFYYIGVELIIVFAIFCVSDLLARKENFFSNTLIIIGRMSFPIYLYHQFIWAGAVVSITNRFDSPILVVMRPFVVGLIVIIELKLGESIAKRMNKLELYQTMTGMGR